MVWSNCARAAAVAAAAASASLPGCAGDEVVDSCLLCPAAGWELLTDVVPAPVSSLDDGDGPYSLIDQSNWLRTVATAAAALGSDGEGLELTCGQWQNFADGLTSDAGGCVDLRSRLLRSCCGGLPSVYECEEAIMERLGVGADLHKTVAPRIDGPSMNVSLLAKIEGLEIDNHGVDGGAIRILASIELAWTDPRLAWNDLATRSDAQPDAQPDTSAQTMLGCASVNIDTDGIWTPAITEKQQDDGELDLIAHKVTLLADGRVFWTRSGKLLAACETLPEKAKLCTAQFIDPRLADRVKYIAKATGSATLHFLLAAEYRLNHDLSTITASGDHHHDAVAMVSIEWETKTALSLKFHFDPIHKQCNICGRSPRATLINATIPYISKQWRDQFPHTVEHTCFQMDSFLADLSVMEDVCDMGRANFEEHCCDDTASSFECESNIHDLLVNDLNTITPPDPSSSEKDVFFRTKDKVDVNVNVDILHMVDVDITSNTMELLVALELSWYDERLLWEPFIGGCHHATFRASLNAELTEIWVPEIELINQMEGVNALPEAHASVGYDGYIRWRRTGTLKASCDVTGVEKFPFDRTGCYFEFGGTRDPRYHRINYVVAGVDYSQRIMFPLGFQEYTMDVDQTTINLETETMSGFANEVIRIQFFFTRAHGYYVHAFILLYILFTYLSFGMFFVDYRIGERLGYGSSILFVLAAQDLTIADYTPVTNKILWIVRLSFCSKNFVIFGIIQSIVVLYLYSYDDFNDDDHDGGSQQEDSEEVRPFINAEAGCGESMKPISSTTSTAKLESCRECQSIVPQEKCGLAPRQSSALTKGPKDEGMTDQKSTSRFPSEDDSEEDKDEEEICGDEMGNAGGSAMSNCAQQMRGIWDIILRRDFFRIQRTDSKLTKRVKQLRKVDWAVALFCFLSYSVYLIVLFEVLL